jgi:hypothetical protein
MGAAMTRAVFMWFSVTMVVCMIMPMIMPMMGVSKSKQTDNIDQKAEGADDEQFVQPSELMACV